MRTGSQNFGLMYFMLAVVQIVICNCFHLTPYISLSILPAMILCLPATVSTTAALLLAFGTGLAVDLLGEGLLGINALSLVPVALTRKFIVQIVFGKDVIEREEDFSFRKYGALKVSLAVLIALGLFLVIYITADGAGTRPFWFNLGRFSASLGCSWLLCMLTAWALLPEDRR